MKILSGSVKQGKYSLTPFEKAESNIFQMVLNMHTSYTFVQLSERIELINTILALPVVSSSNETRKNEGHRSYYEEEIKEIEKAIKIYCTTMDVPEA